MKKFQIDSAKRAEVKAVLETLKNDTLKAAAADKISGGKSMGSWVKSGSSSWIKTFNEL